MPSEHPPSTLTFEQAAILHLCDQLRNQERALARLAERIAQLEKQIGGRNG